MTTKAWTIWCETMKRPGLKMAAGDITKALAWFRENTSQYARIITLSPKNECFSKEAGDGVEVRYMGGCLVWEIWLSDGDEISAEKAPVTVDDHPVIMATLNGIETEVATIQPSVATRASPKRGRKQKSLPLERIAMLAGQGIGSKGIATMLKAEGVSVGFRTIARILSGERVSIRE